MADRKPLVLTSGNLHELPPGDTLGLSAGGTGATTAAGARTNLGLGTIATQNSNSVTITGGTINGTVIGGSTAAAGTFTTLNASGAITVTGASVTSIMGANGTLKARFLQGIQSGTTNDDALFLNYASGHNVQIGNTSGSLIIPAGNITLRSGTSTISLVNSDASAGFWIRNDGVNPVISTKVGDIYYGFSGRTGMFHRFGANAGSPVMVVGNDAGAGVGFGTASFAGVEIRTALPNETARGADNLRLGIYSGTPRIIFEDAGSTMWQIDNSSGAFRWFTPGVLQMNLTTTGLGVGSITPTQKLTVSGNGLNSTLRLANGSDSTGGAYFMSYFANQGYYSAGIALESNTWKAKATSASILGQDSGYLTFQSGTGLTVGNTYSLTEVYRVTPSGHSEQKGFAHLYKGQDYVFSDFTVLKFGDDVAVLYDGNPLELRWSQLDAGYSALMPTDSTGSLLNLRASTVYADSSFQGGLVNATTITGTTAVIASTRLNIPVNNSGEYNPTNNGDIGLGTGTGGYCMFFRANGTRYGLWGNEAP